MSFAFAGCIRARTFPASRPMTISTPRCSHNANGTASLHRQGRRARHDEAIELPERER
jgi:hypothetical protein